ncbi:MAG: hypothetical protein A2W25_17070 [candidate division Zixibacteria bacterium RBG_16_53_22]|nr:MAG: hypothetical protein A2W25_17070 [candidate division Zixibacteria bacterium RBG_16_53_22]
MKKCLLALLIFVGGLSATGSIWAAETKVEGRIYSTWSMYLNDTVSVDGVDLKGSNQFSLDRSYMTLKSKLTDYTSVSITADLSTRGGFSGYDLILKNGYANFMMPFYRPLSLSLGLQPTKYAEFIDGTLWQRRYLEKNIGDRVEFLTTADLGATIDHQLGDMGNMGSVGLSIWNGAKYSSIAENNKNKDFNFYAALKPLVNNADFMYSVVGGQFYAGTQNVVIDTSMDAGDFKRQIISLGGKVNYRDYFDLGLDYWMNTLGQVDSLGAPTDDLKSNAMMIFGALYFKNLVPESSLFRTLNLLVRYDTYDPNTDSDAGKNKQNYMIIGLECQPAKGINASVNYRSTSFEDSDMDSQNYLFLNTEFKF